MARHAYGMIEGRVVNVARRDHLDDFKRDYCGVVGTTPRDAEPPKKKKKRRNRAGAAPAARFTKRCALLFTKSYETSALYRSMSRQFDGRVGLGEVRAAHKSKLLHEFNLSADNLPALISIDGDDHSFTTYDGKVSAEDIKDWLKNVQGGFKLRDEL